MPGRRERERERKKERERERARKHKLNVVILDGIDGATPLAVRLGAGPCSGTAAGLVQGAGVYHASLLLSPLMCRLSQGVHHRRLADCLVAANVQRYSSLMFPGDDRMRALYGSILPSKGR